MSLGPMSLVQIRFLKVRGNGPAEVLLLNRREILRVLLAELVDLLVEFVVHFFLHDAADFILNVIARIPLALLI